MIHKTTGRLELSESITIQANDTFEKINALKLGEVQEVRDMQNGYKWLTIKNLQVDKHFFILSLCFHNNRLISVNILVDDKRFDLNLSWIDWSEEDELTKLAVYKKWIKAELGHEGKFPWGEISASYDQKGGSTSVVVRYIFS